MAGTLACYRVRSMAIGVLFVCTGNICRSPMAAGVFSTLVQRAGMEQDFVIDSAGTFDGQVGQPASPLAIETAKLRGYGITAHRAKLLTVSLVKQFDLPIAMDRTHLAALRWMVARERQDIPTLLMRFAPELNLDEVADLFEGFRSELKAARSG